MPALTYYNNIPSASQRLKDSQPQIQTNFANLKSFLEINHVAFSDADSGKHKFLQMPEQAAAPASAVNEMAVYTKEQGGASQLFVRRENNGTEINITNDVYKGTVGWTRLPNGLIAKWGYVVGSGPRDALQPAYSYPVGGGAPAFTSIYTVLIGSTQMVNNVLVANAYQQSRLYSYSVTQIQVFTSGLVGSGGTATDWTYLSIGI